MLKNKFFDYRSFIILGLSIMQVSVLSEAALGSQGKIIFLVAGFLFVTVGAFKTFIIAIKINIPFKQVYILILTFVPFELIVWAIQPEMSTFTFSLFRFICYFLIIIGYLSGKLSYKSTRYSKAIYNLIIPLLVIATAFMYNKTLSSIALYAKGRVTGGEDISAVGLAFSLCLMGSLCISQLFSNRRLPVKLIHFAAVFSIIPPVIASASRGALLSLVAVFLLFYLISLKSQDANMFKVVGSILAIFFGSFLFLTYMSSNEFLSDQLTLLIERFSRLFEGEEDTSSVGRSLIINIYLDRYDEFIITGYPGYAGPYPHNLFLDFFIRYGIYGFFIALIVYSKTWFVAINLPKLIFDPVTAMISAVVLFSFINSQISMTSEFLRFYWFGLAYLLSFLSKEKKSTHKYN